MQFVSNGAIENNATTNVIVGNNSMVNNDVIDNDGVTENNNPVLGNGNNNINKTVNKVKTQQLSDGHRNQQ
ncbi:MAG: hypothetical protein LBG48_04680 [Rickettsiales bacterium]|nr:hypothetical protein [Rickettsiales bacterium]